MKQSHEIRREYLFKVKSWVDNFIPVSEDMKEFNGFVELFDFDTNYQFDRAGVYVLACLIPEDNRLAEFKTLAGKVGYSV